MSEEKGGGDVPRVRALTLMRGEEDADAALRRLLKAYGGPVGALPLAEARALFAAGELSGPPDEGLLAHRATFCLARALEEFARLGLMDWDPLRHPLEVFLSLEINELKGFFARCRKGLSEEQLCRVTGFGTKAAMRKVRGLDDEAMAGADEALAWSARREADSLKELAKLYHCSPADADPTLGPWQMGFGGLTYGAVYLPPKPLPKGETDTPESDDTPGEVWIGLESVGGAPATLSWSPALATAHLSEEVLVMLQEICSRTQVLANLKLALLDDPRAGVKAALKAFAAERERLGGAKPEPPPPPPPIGAESITAPVPEPKAEAEHTKQVRQVGGLKIIHSDKLHEQT